MTTTTAEAVAQSAPETNGSVKIRAGRLLNVLVNAALFASTDSTLPVLCCVQLTVSGKYLVGGATDRYALAYVKAELEEDGTGEAFRAVVPTAALKSLTPVLKAAARIDDTVTLAVEGATLLYQTAESTGTVSLHDAEAFPKIGSLVDSAAANIAGPVELSTVPLISVDPGLLARVGKVKDHRGKGDPTRSYGKVPVGILAQGDPRKAVYWALEDWARGLIMPVRRDDYSPEAVIGAWNA
ncbi:hypothetical protein SPF06_18505 [Sinomonas sp. JGH33]|uniref:DNA polymerase III beta sliding clamp central domain-containing protein n=1 Tax=Sinomonas terricola TaxID=3110330 RepID=A0ABU5TB51_9MICC|nr:hypothetical protein [Sinomonas sp. JGH33]MEA5456719.1 hypothetical protein [Sinomonas sp. JGH33]